MAFSTWLQSVFPTLFGRMSEGSSRLLLEHFMLLLHDEFVCAQHPSDQKPVDNPAIVQEIQTLLAKPGRPTYERAYEIERLLVYIRPRRRLYIEVDRRVDEAQGLGLASAANYRSQLNESNALVSKAMAAQQTAGAALDATAGTGTLAQAEAAAKRANTQLDEARENADALRRSILAAVLDDLQWTYQKDNLVRRAKVRSTRNVSMFGFLCVMVCGLPFIAFALERQFEWTFFSKFVDHFPNYGLYSAVSFGLLGAFFSRLTSFNTDGVKSVEDADNRYRFRSLLVRGAVGMCGAMIMYYLLQTGIMGTVAPKFDQLSYMEMRDIDTMIGKGTVLLPSKDWCLLVVLSFVAGFSEKLVPDSLSRVENQATTRKT